MRTLRIDPISLDRFKYCWRSRNYIWQKWKQYCEYTPFTDKVKIKELLDKGFVLKARVKP